MRILVAGVGNVLLGDDGFGPAVIAALRAGAGTAPVAGAAPAAAPAAPAAAPAATVEVADFGVRGFDLALALTAGVDAAILVDAALRGGAPGTLYLIEPAPGPPAELDAHALDAARVLALAASLGAPPRVVRVVGCEPARLGGQDGALEQALSAPVARAIEPAARMVRDLIARLAEGACTS